MDGIDQSENIVGGREASKTRNTMIYGVLSSETAQTSPKIHYVVRMGKFKFYNYKRKS